MRNLLLCVVLMAAFVTGESLTCESCRMAFTGRCLFGSTETCSDSEPNCYKGKVAFNISDFSLHSRGCLSSSRCNQTETGSLLTFGYTVTKTCCGTNNCNGATSVQLHLPAAVAAVAAVWSLFIC